MSATINEIVLSDRKREYPTSEGWQYITLEDVAGINTCTLKNKLTNGMPVLYEWAMFKRASGVAYVIVRKRRVEDCSPFTENTKEPI